MHMSPNIFYMYNYAMLSAMIMHEHGSISFHSRCVYVSAWNIVVHDCALYKY